MDTKHLDYQALQQQLQEVLAKLQSENTDVESAVAAYEQGVKLVAELTTYLETAENKISKLQQSFGDAV